MLLTDWSPQPSAHLLVLEDDPTLRDILRELLEDEGHTVTAAASGTEALQAAQSHPIDLFIFDIRMEGIDGLEALARMLAGGHDFPSLAITGFAGDDDPVRALRLGVGEYLRKPFRNEQLLEAVNRLLQRDAQRREHQRRLESLREVALWATGKPPHPRLASLAQAAGLSPGAIAELELVDTADPSQPDCPPRVQSWLQAVDEHYDGSGPQGLKGNDIPLESRLLAVARAAKTARDLSKQEPGRYDPILLETLEGLEPSGSAAALALAWQAPPADTFRHVHEAVEQARQVGPVALANAFFRGGMLLRRRHLPQAEAALRQAYPRLVALGLNAQACLVELAVGNVRQEAVEVLLRPENEGELTAEIDWVQPLLNGQGAGWERVQRLLATRYGSGTVLRIRSFGHLEVSWAGTVLEESAWRGPFVKHLFAFLAAQERPVQEDLILEHFWPEHHERCKRRLSGALSAIRSTFTKAAGSPVDPILRSRDRYELNPRLDVWHDLREFDKARQEKAWDRMASLYAAPYLEGCYMDWALALRTRLEEQLI